MMSVSDSIYYFRWKLSGRGPEVVRKWSGKIVHILAMAKPINDCQWLSMIINADWWLSMIINGYNWLSLIINDFFQHKRRRILEICSTETSLFTSPTNRAPRRKRSMAVEPQGVLNPFLHRVICFSSPTYRAPRGAERGDRSARD